MQRVLLANDTGMTSNPGCQSVRRAIDILMEGRKMEISDTLPLGFGAEPFRSIAPPSKACVVVSDGRFPVGTEGSSPIDLPRWRDLRNEMAKNGDLEARMRRADLVVVNGEGSIHHNFPRALALLALIDIAAEFGIATVLLNATIQAMDQRLLAATLPSLGSCHVREGASLTAVLPFFPAALAAADIAVLAIDRLPFSDEDHPVRQEKKCLLSAGVLVRPAIVKAMIERIRLAGFTPTYLSVGDGGETEVASKVCAENGIDVFHAKDHALPELSMLLGGYDIAVCGRHHLNLILMRAGVPTVPLPSNTWKIEETLSALSYPMKPLLAMDELTDALLTAWRDRDMLRAAGKAGFTAAVRSLDGVADRLFAAASGARR